MGRARAVPVAPMLALLDALRPRHVPRHQPGDAGGAVLALVHLRALAAGPAPGPRARGSAIFSSRPSHLERIANKRRHEHCLGLEAKLGTSSIGRCSEDTTCALLTSRSS
eukprot:7999638-Pyramimonas_sp.AAC.1